MSGVVRRAGRATDRVDAGQGGKGGALGAAGATTRGSVSRPGGRRAFDLRIGPVTRRVTLRALLVNAVLALAVLACLTAAVSLGSRTLSLGEILAALAPDASGINRTIVWEWRAPRAVAAVLFGAALGLSGAIFQALTRNPLGSPDIIGLNTGAFTGVVAVTMLGGAGYLTQAGGALIGGLATSGLVYLLAWRRGIQGFRLIIIGIAVSAMLGALNQWFTVKADLSSALSAAVWGAGTVSGVSWRTLGTVAIVLLLLMATMPWVTRTLRQLELGDDTAAALGLPLERGKLLLIVVGVALTAIVTAAAGPIAFIALAAPHIGRRLTGHGASVDAVASALTGAVLLCGSDLVAQHALPGASLPVGSVTVVIGGGYLVWLLMREAGRP